MHSIAKQWGTPKIASKGSCYFINNSSKWYCLHTLDKDAKPMVYKLIAGYYLWQPDQKDIGKS